MSERQVDPMCIGFSAVTALGPSVRHTGFYLRAGRNNFSQSPFVDAFGDPITLACSTTLPKHLAGIARLEALASASLEQALTPLSASLRPSRTRLLLALPDRLRGPSKAQTLSKDGSELCQRLRTFCERFTEIAELHAFPFGIGAGGSALLTARALLSRGEADAVVLCGVDSYYDAEVLAELERTDRLMTPDNLDSLRPGEAAATLVLVAPRHKLARAHGISRFVGIGVGDEPTARDPDAQSMAHGLSAAMREAVAPLRDSSTRCNMLFADVTHEQSRVRELQILFARFGDVLGFDMLLAMPARELGEVGSATLPLYVALCSESWLRGYAVDPHAICFGASAHGLCGALLLSAGPIARSSWV